MAFTLNNLENHSGSGAGVRIFSYSTTGDNRATVTASGYFNNAAGLLAVGSRILVHCSDTDFDCHVVSISAANVVVTGAIDAFA
jgi:hypothetical protein